MTAAARPITARKPPGTETVARHPGRASNVVKALGGVGSAIMARIAAAMAPRPVTRGPYVARVTRDYGRTWEEWPFAGYGGGR